MNLCFSVFGASRVPSRLRTEVVTAVPRAKPYNKEEAEAKLFDIIEKMRVQNKPMMSYLEKRKDSLEKRIEMLEERSREFQEEISVLQWGNNVSV